VLVEDDDPRPVLDRTSGGRHDRLGKQGMAQAGRDRGSEPGQRLHVGLGEPGLVGLTQEGRRAPVDAVGDKRYAQFVAEIERLVGPVPGRAGELAVGVEAGGAGDLSAVGEDGPLVDVLGDVLVVSQPRGGAADVAVDAAGEQDRARVDRVAAVSVEPDDGRR